VFTTRVAFDGAGNALAVWDRQDPASEIVEIWGSARPAGAGWDGEGNISDLGSSGHEPRLAFGGTWSGVVAWEIEDTGGRTIYAATLQR
jgi:hypothetical protein